MEQYRIAMHDRLAHSGECLKIQDLDVGGWSPNSHHPSILQLRMDIPPK
ncbi:MAG: hypothetical protein CM1200mP3_01760 [Chloroflexota bacterium]|nr:MAG: hypothetical protein CM1200mP3_01760 [Chloroflexota bacterium]